MQLTRSVPDTRAALRALRSGRAPDTDGKTLALVPTMGALHAGHMSLITAAKAEADLVVTSIFVNPLQFAPTEDLARYPRPFERDRQLLETAGVDLLFAPTVDDIYPHGQAGITTIDVPELSSRLDGASRPGHFRGVATVVAKLFHIVQPDLAFFGQKDAAQVAVLRRMVADLNLPVTLRICPTVREPDGLALSSRNRYLCPVDRIVALALSRALHAAQQQIAAGVTDAATLAQILRDTLLAAPALRLDYVAVVDPDTLAPISDTHAGALLAVAAWVGATRLIDNLLLPAPETTSRKANSLPSTTATADQAEPAHA